VLHYSDTCVGYSLLIAYTRSARHRVCLPAWPCVPDTAQIILHFVMIRHGVMIRHRVCLAVYSRRNSKWLTLGVMMHHRAACNASLERLGIATIDLYYLHRKDPQTPIEETWRAMAVRRPSGRSRRKVFL
jgi:Aldo/keto reductase family